MPSHSHLISLRVINIGVIKLLLLNLNGRGFQSPCYLNGIGAEHASKSGTFYWNQIPDI